MPRKFIAWLGGKRSAKGPGVLVVAHSIGNDVVEDARDIADGMGKSSVYPYGIKDKRPTIEAKVCDGRRAPLNNLAEADPNFEMINHDFHVLHRPNISRLHTAAKRPPRANEAIRYTTRLSPTKT